ncbi:MAG: DUF1015 domain-containing protein [Oscillospiraceae bacterium]
MKKSKDIFAMVGAKVPRILLPRKGTKYDKFSVIACDQHSADPEYWQSVKDYVGDAPSALNMILPEAWLERQGEQTTDIITNTMRQYLDDGILEDRGECLISVHRTTDCGMRKGLMIALDLEQYDYSKNAKTLIRATEDTVVDRLPARIAVREKAPIEMPHVMVLINDRLNMLEGVIERNKEAYEVAYNFDLMKGGGHIRGRIIDKPQDLLDIAGVLETLYRQSEDGFMYAMGDGNHSFAAAKQRWEKLKPTLSSEQRQNHPARYAMAELVNIYDHGLGIEPIHRLLSGVNAMQVQREIKFDAANPPSLQELQPRLDRWLARHPEATLEYIHGEDECRRLGEAEGRMAIIFPKFDRESIFSIVREKGAFVRKSFSLGNANGKRYYLECRKIVD